MGRLRARATRMTVAGRGSVRSRSMTAIEEGWVYRIRRARSDWDNPNANRYRRTRAPKCHGAKYNPIRKLHQRFSSLAFWFPKGQSGPSPGRKSPFSPPVAWGGFR